MKVNIKNGLHRGNKVEGIFEVAKEWKSSPVGGYITVVTEATGIFKTRWPRIKVDPADFTLIDDGGTPMPAMGSDSQPQLPDLIPQETDEEIIERIRHTFSMLNEVTDSVIAGIIRGLVISGPPGVGKSFGVEERLRYMNIPNEIANITKYEIVSGEMSAPGLYKILYKNSSRGFVTCFDDADGILFDEECLTLLKAALNSGDRRRLCWHKDSRSMAADGIPDAFDFHGAVIFITNVDFERTIKGNSRIGAHLGAIVSRCHYIDLAMGSARDKMLRIKQIVNDGMLTRYGFSNDEERTILNWITDKESDLRELSLRTVSKLADLVKALPNTWESLATTTLLTKEARFRQLYRS